MSQGSWPPVPSSNQLIANRYRKGKSLGEGGFGEVFYAEDTKFKIPRPVAIKFIHPHLLTDLQVREEIINEANALARFKHRNILRIIDFEVEKDMAFIVTELAEGGSLAQKIKPDASQPPKPMPRQEVLFYLERIASALDEAHKQNVIHRDIKPANILLDVDDEPLLSDFGFAMSLANSITIETLTSVYGTPQYVAPEVWNDQAGKASDIYALGVMLYEMITGYTPFIGTVDELREMHLTGSIPSLKDRYPRLKYPQELDAVIAKALSKDLNQRYDKATDLYKAFKDALDKQDLPPQKPVLQKPKATRKYTSNPFYPELEDIDFGEVDAPKPLSKAQQKRTLQEDLAQYKHDKNWNKVIEVGEKLLELFPTNKIIKANLADAYFQCGKLFVNNSIWREAIHNFEIAIKYDAKNGDYFRELGLCYYNQKNYQTASSNFKQAIQYNPNNSLDYGYLGKCQYKINIDRPKTDADLNLAIESFSKAISLSPYFNSPNLEEYHGLLAMSLIKRARGNDIQDAITHLDTAILLSGNNADYYFMRGTVKTVYSEKLADFTKAIQFDPTNSYYYEQRATTNYQIKDYQAVVTDYNLSFKYGNKSLLSYTELGDAYYSLGNYDGAIASYNHVINSSNKINWYHFYQRGNCLYEQNKYQLALKDFREALSLVGIKHIGCYMALGKCYYFLDDYDNALAHFGDAMKIQSLNKRDIYYWRGKVYKALNNKKAAKLNFENAINLGHAEARNEKKSLGWFTNLF